MKSLDFSIDRGTFAGVGFAIPIDTVAKNVGAMIEEGKGEF